MKINNIPKIVGAASALFTIGLLGASTIGTVSAATQLNANQLNNQTVQGQNGQKFDQQRPPMLTDVKRTVKNIDNGVQITLTSTNADTVKKLQEMQPKNPPQDAQNKVTFAQTNITDGVQITLTSTDADTVKKLQEDAKNERGPGFGGPGMHRGMGQDLQMKNVQRTVKNIDNGVQITLTSTDPDTVKKLQEDAKNERGPGFGGPGMHGEMSGDHHGFFLRFHEQQNQNPQPQADNQQ